MAFKYIINKYSGFAVGIQRTKRCVWKVKMVTYWNVKIWKTGLIKVNLLLWIVFKAWIVEFTVLVKFIEKYGKIKGDYTLCCLDHLKGWVKRSKSRLVYIFSEIMMGMLIYEGMREKND